jgi:hypothetical protein
MSRIILVAGFWLLAGFASAIAAEPRPPSLYERLAAKLERDPALAARIGKPAPEMAQIAWLIGEWDVTARVFATRQEPERVSQGRSKVTAAFGGVWLQFADSYGASSPDLSFMTFSPVKKKWLTVTIDETTNAITTAVDRWTGNRLIFVGQVEIVGEQVTLRQTLQKISDSAYRVLNEERLPDGTWAALDEYSYKKR